MAEWFSAPVERIALVNPPWRFEGSRFWACREPHLPIELLYAEAILRRAGFRTRVVDAHLEGLSIHQLADQVAGFQPNLIVITTAPTYLFWRCAQPELDLPAEVCRLLRATAPVVAVGPHGSATPGYVLGRLGCDAVVRGEPEEELLRLAAGEPSPATVWGVQASRGELGSPTVADVARLPALDYSDYPLEHRAHRHHVFWGDGRGAEVESSRGCPYHCSFCNRRYFRTRYRARPIESVIAELKQLRSRGVDYVYFIDEIFGLGQTDALLQILAEERIMHFGCQTRIDLWDERRLDQLAAAGCISVEFGLESPFPEIQSSLKKGYHIEPERILELMVYAKSRIPWVQGDLVELPGTPPDLRRKTEEWRQKAIGCGVWVSEPVRLFPYPGSDLYEQMIGPVDDESWLRAQATC